MKELLTTSRMACLLACPRKHYWRYEVYLQRDTDALALRFGSAWHDAMEARWQGECYDDALGMALATDRELDEAMVATVAGLLAGYYARWQSDPVTVVEPEREFRYALRGSRSFDLAGKIDGLGHLHDGRLVLVEHKTTASDVGSGSDYWLRLRANPQVMQYVLGARAIGWDVDTVLYDVTRKPTIRVRKDETPEEYGERLAADCAERPDFYFARREVPILEDDLAEHRVEQQVLARSILGCRAEARTAARPEHGWPRNLSEMSCKLCEYSSFCLQNIVPDPAMPPAGFKVGRRNPELAENDGNIGAET